MSESLLGGDAGGARTGEGGTPPNDGDTNTVATIPDFLKGIEGLDTEILGDPSLKPIKDINGLIKSYINAQKMVGADKVIVPKKDSPATEWDSLFQKLGKPSKLEEYTLSKPQESVYDDTFLETFKTKAFELNILPDQAQKLFEALNAKEVEENKAFVNQAKEKYTASVNELKQEYGQAFEQKIKQANDAVIKLGGEPLKNHLKESGIGNDPHLVRAFVKLSEMINKEDNAGSPTPTGGALSPAEAKLKYFDIINDKNHPYNDSGKSGHKEAVEHVHTLFKYMSNKS